MKSGPRIPFLMLTPVSLSLHPHWRSSAPSSPEKEENVVYSLFAYTFAIDKVLEGL
jgi:hypothetical protein